MTTRVRKDDAPQKLQDKYEKMNQGFDDATMRQAVENIKNAHGTDWKSDDNCQDFVQRAVDEYFRLKDEAQKKKQEELNKKSQECAA